MTPAGLLLCDDLLFGSKVTATARAHGLAVAVCRDFPRLLAAVVAGRPRTVLLDLHNPTLDLSAVAGWVAGGVRVIAFGSHVDVAALKAARAAGCDRVMPRSQFAAALEVELPGWLADWPSQQPLDNQRPQPEDVLADGV